MPTHQDETLPQRYAREHQDYLKLCGSMTAEQVADLQLQLNNSLAREQALQQRLTAADERVDHLEADKRAMTETHVLYTWLRKKCDQPSNDVVAVHMNIGHDWATVFDLDTDLRAMIEREEP